MLDAIYAAVAVAFFVLAAAYVAACNAVATAGDAGDEDEGT